jgi:hypothetical protein
VELKSVVAYVDSASPEGAWFAAGGFPVRKVSDDHVIVTLGSVELELHTAASETIDEFVIEAAATPRMRGIYLYFRVPDIEAAFAAYRKLSKYDAPISRPWGNSEFLISSPGGVKIVIYSR